MLPFAAGTRLTFEGTDGRNPLSPLLQASDGAFYGTTVFSTSLDAAGNICGTTEFGGDDLRCQNGAPGPVAVWSLSCFQTRVRICSVRAPAAGRVRCPIRRWAETHRAWDFPAFRCDVFGTVRERYRPCAFPLVPESGSVGFESRRSTCRKYGTESATLEGEHR